MKEIFESARIGGIESKNRLVRSATQEGAAEDGRIGEELLSIYRKLSEGGVGIIITGMVGIDENSRALSGMIRGYEDAFVTGMREIAANAHKNASRVVVQLAHCGAKAKPDGGGDSLAPSVISLDQSSSAKSMTKEEIQKVVESFAAAALRCKEAGADGVQLHVAHGYLLSEFLSPHFNQRDDEYGGSIANRARIVFEVYEAVREAVKEEYPIWIKINSEDFVEGGMSAEESLWVCQELDKRGINGIEISGGVGISTASTPARIGLKPAEKGIFSDAALSAAAQVKADVISVGGYRTPEMIEHILNVGKIQAVSICRPLICQPDLPHLWEQGDRAPGKCIFCNKCFDFSSGFGCKVFR